MTKMIKVVSACLASMALAFGATACGSSDTTTGTTSTTSTPVVTTSAPTTTQQNNPQGNCHPDGQMIPALDRKANRARFQRRIAKSIRKAIVSAPAATAKSSG